MQIRSIKRNQPGHFYKYSNPPKVVPSSEAVSLLLRTGNVKKIQQLILDGQGYKLLGQCSPDPKIRNLLKSVPFYMARIDMLHEAVSKGQLNDVRVLMKTKATGVFPPPATAAPIFQESQALACCKDHTGVGLLHKAVYYSYFDIVRWLVENYPKTVNHRDKLGRIPLHYVNGESKEKSDKIWKLLVNAGSDVDVEDVNGKTPSYYLDCAAKAELPNMRDAYGDIGNMGSVIKASNIRVWIHDQQIDKLQRVLLEGHGEKLLTETSNKPLMKKFLNCVPYILVTVRQIHKCVIEGDLPSLKRITSHPMSPKILMAKDAKGVTPLHKAIVFGNSDLVKYVLGRCPETVNLTDNEGRCPLHYVTAFKKGDILYDMLVEAGASEQLTDNNGKIAKFCKINKSEIADRLESLRDLPNAPRVADEFPPSWDWIFSNDDTIPKRNRERIKREIEITNKRVEECTFVRKEGVNVKEYTINNYSSYENAVEIEKNAPDETGQRKRDVIRSKPPHNSPDGTEIGESEEAKFLQEASRYQPILPPSMKGGSRQGGKNQDKNGNSDDDSAFPERLHGASNSEILSMVGEIIRTERIEKLAHFVLEGYGAFLLGLRSFNPHVASFLNNVPVYLDKIEAIHAYCEKDDVEGLNACIDRRKFAVAKESKTKFHLTPIHTAVLSASANVITYLANRFPETLSATDATGKTALHLAAITMEDVFIYDTLLAHGSDEKRPDHDGKSAEFYFSMTDGEKYEILKNYVKELSGKGGRNTDKLVLFDHFLNPTEKRYLMDSVGKVLKNALTEVASVKPKNPVKFLADYLNNYESESQKSPTRVDIEIYTNESKGNFAAETNKVEILSTTKEDAEKTGNDVGGNGEDADVISGELWRWTDNFKPISRDECGQTLLHFAAARRHNQGAFLQMLQEMEASISFRDDLYRTARDVAMVSDLNDNVRAIDSYILYMAARGMKEKLFQLSMEGYDHVTDISEGMDIIKISSERGSSATLKILRCIPLYENRMKNLHDAIYRGSKTEVESLLTGKRNGLMLALWKDGKSRCSLHVAVLKQHAPIVEYIAGQFRETLSMGDNLERTALHYSMGVESVEVLSEILIKAGANRTAKDLRGKQASYYFVNRNEISEMQNEMP